jgi:hypothetical protein
VFAGRVVLAERVALDRRADAQAVLSGP